MTRCTAWSLLAVISEMVMMVYELIADHGQHVIVYPMAFLMMSMYTAGYLPQSQPITDQESSILRVRAQYADSLIEIEDFERALDDILSSGS